MTPLTSQFNIAVKVTQPRQAEMSPRLPDEALVQIFKILDKTDRTSFAHVNRQWRQTALPLVQTLYLGVGKHQLDLRAERFPALRKIVCLAPTPQQLISVRYSQSPSKTLIQVCPEWQFEVRELRAVKLNDILFTHQSDIKSSSNPIAALFAILHFREGLKFAWKLNAHPGLAFMAVRTNFRELSHISPQLRKNRHLILLGLRGCISYLRDIENEDVNSQNAIQRLMQLEEKISNCAPHPFADKDDIEREIDNVFLTLELFVQLETLASTAT